PSSSRRVQDLLRYTCVRRLNLHSLPTRRTSDLPAGGTADRAGGPASGLPDRPAAGQTAVRQRAAVPRPDQLSGQSASVSPSTRPDRKSTRLNSSHVKISYAGFCVKKKFSKSVAE